MWVVYCFLSYLALALMIPLGWALGRVWTRARQSRDMYCPVSEDAARVKLDPWYAVRMHALGNPELCVKDCSQWPTRHDCRQLCLVHISNAA